MYYLILLLVVAAVFIYIYRWKKLNIPETRVDTEEKKPSRKWVFNGILDIDNPPEDKEPFDNYKGTLQLRVRPGYMHYDLMLDKTVDDETLGLYAVEVRTAADGKIDVFYNGKRIGCLPDGQKKLYEDLNNIGGSTTDSYAFVAKKMLNNNPVYFGEVAIAKI